MISEDITYLSLNFDDFETFKAAAAKWSLEFKQLDSGSFHGEISLLDSSQIQIGTTKLNRKLDQRGIAPAGYRTFIVPMQECGRPYIWRGHKVLENELLIQPRNGEFSSISSPGWGIFTVSIAEELALDYIESFKTSESNGIDISAEVIQLSAQSMNALRKQLDYIFYLANQNSSNILKKTFRQIFFKEIPMMILKNIVLNEQSLIFPKPRIRDIAFKKAIDYLNSCTTEMPTVRELALLSGSSERTLEYAFKEKYGFGPKEFIRKQLLNQVRAELMHHKLGYTKVQDVALHFGFLHMGHFSSQYKKLFGELPSETYKQTN